MQKELIAKLEATLKARDQQVQALSAAMQQAQQECAQAAGPQHVPAGLLEGEDVPDASPSDATNSNGLILAEGSSSSAAVVAAAAAASADAAAGMPAVGTPEVVSRSESLNNSSKGRPSSAAGSRRTSTGQQRVPSRAGSSSSNNSRGGMGSRPLSGMSKPYVLPAGAAAAVDDDAAAASGVGPQP